MRDLYKTLQIAPVSEVAAIEAALRDPARTRHPDARHARAILLNPSRRAQYDRVHSSLRHIGQLRSLVGLQSTAYAREHERDFGALQFDFRRVPIATRFGSFIASVRK